jgi:hypothetical protein
MKNWQYLLATCVLVGIVMGIVAQNYRKNSAFYLLRDLANKEIETQCSFLEKQNLSSTYEIREKINVHGGGKEHWQCIEEMQLYRINALARINDLEQLAYKDLLSSEQINRQIPEFIQQYNYQIANLLINDEERKEFFSGVSDTTNEQKNKWLIRDTKDINLIKNIFSQIKFRILEIEKLYLTIMSSYSFGGCFVGYDKPRVIIVPNSLVVQKGDDFEATISLAYSGGAKPTITIENTTKLLDADGFANYKRAFTKSGKYTINGKIIYQKSVNDKQTIPFSQVVWVHERCE